MNNPFYQLTLSGTEAGTWFVDLKNGCGSLGQGESPAPVQCTMTMSSDDFVSMFAGDMKPTAAFMAGKLKIQGDLTLAMKLEKVMGQTRSKL